MLILFRTSRHAKHFSLSVLLCFAFCFKITPVYAETVSSSEYTQTFGRGFSKLVAAIPANRVSSETRLKALQALDLIGKYRLREASSLLNKALQLDPTNSYLQFFNAFDYHLMARDGDTKKYSLAEQGYQLAIKFDRANWVAHYYLGMLYFEQRNFPAAQNKFAEVLLFQEDDQEVLFRMVAASYYSQDPITAAACLDRLRALNPTDKQILRLSAIISAAIGRGEDADKWLLQYQATSPDTNELLQLQERLKHWRMVYQNLPNTTAAPESSGNQVVSNTQMNPANLLPVQFSFPVLQPGQQAPGQQIQAQGQSSNTQIVTPVVATSDGRMILVDVVLMYTEDTLTTSKGVNMLNALTVQFGNGTTPAYSGGFSSSTTDGVSTSTAAITNAINIPALTYSLNIANANTNLTEVLARPTLAALNGLRSEFFSGETLDAAVVSTGANTGGSVQVSKEIGVKLVITPIFLPDGRIQMSVDAQRTFLKPPSSNVSFTYKVEVTKIMVNANVVMNIGETLVLGGLSEKETNVARGGVPFLQDIPILQYFFSNKTTTDYQRSVLMLITPRLPQYTYRPDEVLRQEAGGNANAQSIQELRARYGDWFAPYPNMSSVFHQLNNSSIYREFRTGDVTLEKWDRQETTLQRLKQALGFLFY